MYLEIMNNRIPGTILNRKEMGDVSGLAFLSKIFFITDGIMLSQVREITGIDGSTLQNWTKRGWVANSVNKRYSIDQLARIIIINMLRDSMQLEKIAFLLKYINGNVNDHTDDIIPESRLYGMICQILDRITDEKETSNEKLITCILECTLDYQEPISGAKKRLLHALEIILVTYYASLMKSYSNKLLVKLERDDLNYDSMVE